MKKLTTLFLLGIAFMANAQNDFKTTWKTDNPGTSCNTCITIPTTGGGYNYDVDWNNDGVFDEFGITGNITHDFGTAGTYTIRIRGNFPRIYFNNAGDKQKILDISSWGDISWTNMSNAFEGCANLNISATDAPDLSGVTSMSSMFKDCINFNSNINHWDVNNVIYMIDMFRKASSFNQPVDNWNVSNVTNMSYMFAYASSFNQNINDWNVSNVTNMSYMFAYASSFNQNINDWNVSNVTNMSYMFKDATLFNQALNDWNVSNVTNMSYMFNRSSSFNQPLNNWNVSNVTNMSYMFNRSSSFNQPINSWDLSSVTNMFFMFADASSFNQPLDNWNVSNVTNMREMFGGASSFNQPLNNWNVSNVTNMLSMFFNASSFNQPLDNWDVSNVTDMEDMFNGASSFNQAIDNWDVSNVMNMDYMFAGASSFNQPLDNWNVSNVTNMGYMFYGASSFNQNLSSWDVSNLMSNDLEHFFDSCGISPCNYDSTLIGWANLPLQNMLIFGAANVRYTANSAAARQNIIDNYGWTFIGDTLLESFNTVTANATCSNLNEGAITGSFTNIQANNEYTYAWLGNANGTATDSATFTISGLNAGTYTLDIIGNGNCVLYNDIPFTIEAIETSETFDTSTTTNISEVGVFVDTFVNQYGCDSIHTRTVTSAVGIQNILNNVSVNLFPNPANNAFTISIDNPAEKYRVQLTNILGKEVLVLENYTHLESIKINHLAKGQYFVTLFNEGKQALAVKKLIVY